MLADERGDLEVESLLKIVLGLVVVWFVLEIVGEAVETTVAIVDLASPLIGLVVIVLIALWLLDRI